MRMWKKLSLLTVITILFATGVFGGVVVYQTYQYNLNQTIDGYSGQVKANAYAISQEINNSNLEVYSQVTKQSYLKYLVSKYGGNDYMLLSDGYLVCNLTQYELYDRTTARWKSQEIEYEIQHTDGIHILVMGKQLKTADVKTYSVRPYQLVLVKDISVLYEDLFHQAGMFVLVYLVVAAFAMSIIFWVTKHMLRPMNELQRVAVSISQGDLKRRVHVHTGDEMETVGLAFNKMADTVENQVVELEEVSERRKQLLGSLTHELKTPMTSIIGFSDTLLHVKISQDQQKKALEHINAECKRLERLSGKMMNLIGLYDNDSIEMKEFSVEELLRRVEVLESYHLQEQGMFLTVSCSMKSMRMDIDLMESLLVNLIDNAIKASQKGDIIDVLASGNRITVRDRGKGIPDAEISKVTEAFYMVDKSRSKKAGGIGLGLSLCKQIADLHGASLEIESQIGEGTSISIVLLRRHKDEEVI